MGTNPETTISLTGASVQAPADWTLLPEGCLVDFDGVPSSPTKISKIFGPDIGGFDWWVYMAQFEDGEIVKINREVGTLHWSVYATSDIAGRVTSLLGLPGTTIRPDGPFNPDQPESNRPNRPDWASF